MPALEDTVLGVFYVASSTIYTAVPEISRRTNATGIPNFREHPFEHSFIMMALEFLLQALCLPLWYWLTKGVTPEPEGPRYNNGLEAAEGMAIQQAAVDNDDPMLNPGGLVGVQDGHGDDGDEQPLLGGRVVEANNPAWNQRPVDRRKFNKYLFILPALFDLGRYGALYVAFKLTYQSCYMMLRSTCVIFTVMLRVAFLSKHLAKWMWMSISMVVLGLGLIGMTDFFHPFTPKGYDKYGIAAGCLLMAIFNILTAMQVVFEEKFMEKHLIPPLRIIGLEGCFGSVVAVIALIVFSFVKSGPFSMLKDNYIEDIPDAFYQMKSSPLLASCFVARIVSKVIRYYTGVTFVKNQHDSAKRIAIDVQHDLIIWGVSLGLGWQNFFYPQVPGYLMVIFGMLVFCEIIPLPAWCKPDPVPPPQGPPNEEELQQFQEQDRARQEARAAEEERRRQEIQG